MTELSQEERRSAPMLAPELDLSQHGSMGASSSYEKEVRIEETLEQAADLNKSEYTKQQETKERTNNPKRAP